MLTQTVPVSKTGALILVRLLTPPARLGPAALRKHLEPFFRGRDPGAGTVRFDETLAALERDGLVTRRPLALTEAGRAQALEFLGLESLPEGATWPQIKGRYLPAAALGLARTDEAARDRLGKAEGLRVAILRTKYQLPPVDTMPQALNALVRKALEMESTEKITLGTLKAKVLGRFLKLLGNPDLADFKAHLPVDAVKANRNTAEELRAAVVREWLADEGTDEAPAPAEASATEAPFDLAAFADRVRAAARASEAGRFGDNKVFIAHAWRRLRDEDAFPDMTEAEFKQRLTEANHLGVLQLSRADLVEVMDPDDVRASETPYLHAVFHFIQI